MLSRIFDPLKQSISGLDPSDIVAFANSRDGCAIIIGASEEKSDDGSQKVNIVGCPTGDRDKIQILDMALSCVPPIPVEVNIEKMNDLSFYRVEIHSGQEKPYSTSGGTYKTREDGRVRALTPTDLLNILIE